MLLSYLYDLVLLLGRRKPVVKNADDVKGTASIVEAECCESTDVGTSPPCGVCNAGAGSQDLQIEISASDVIASLRAQQLLHNADDGLLQYLFKNGRSIEYRCGSYLAHQDERGNFVYFILHGKVGVYVNDRLVDTAQANECVGEIQALNVLRRRCAALKAEENTTVFAVDLHAVAELFDGGRKANQFLYNETLVLADRIRNRSKFHMSPNQRPVVFIGSSTEAYPIAKRLRVQIERSKAAKVIDWTDNVFLPSRSAMENIERISQMCDFAVMVLSGDDRTSYRGTPVIEPRDNCVFELGFFMGKFGRTRAFFLVDDAKLPTDLNGETYLKYKTGKRVHLSKVVKRLVEEFNTQSVR